MANLFDYIGWRGDLSMAHAPINEVDSLVLGCLCYLPMAGIVPQDALSVTLAQAAEGYAMRYSGTKPRMSVSQSFMDNCVRLLDLCAVSPRYSGIRLCYYVEQMDMDAQKQFAAMTCLLDDGSAYLSFRGTDDTLVGWKEDFNMCYQTPVPAQREAVDYLHTVAQNVALPLWLGGHSKGGNLAVYAIMHARPAVQTRIMGVHNLDGPGLQEDAATDRMYVRIQSRIRTFVPQSSVVGMLLNHSEEYTVVYSSQQGLFQHDPFYWHVLRDRLVHLEQVTGESRFVNHTLQQWLQNMDAGQRARFIDAVYELLGATGATTLSELADGRHRNIGVLLQSLYRADSQTRNLLMQTMNSLIKTAWKNVRLLKMQEPERQPMAALPPSAIRGQDSR